MKVNSEVPFKAKPKRCVGLSKLKPNETQFKETNDEILVQRLQPRYTGRATNIMCKDHKIDEIPKKAPK